MTTKYKIVQTVHGTAYVNDLFCEDLKHCGISPMRALQIPDVVIDQNYNLVKCRYDIHEMTQIYLGVISSPLLSKIVRAYIKARKLFSKA